MPAALQTWMVSLTPGGWTFAVLPQQTLLVAAQQARIILPSSCRNGTCRTCQCRLVSGTARHIIDWPGLSAEEKAQGYILPCVAVAESDLVIEAPRACAAP
ncbi:MAG: 2Fe-2S iron-sulfur cluster-binding protein [Janthinobacterium lividum]